MLFLIHLVSIDGRTEVERNTCCIERGEKEGKYADSEAMVYEQRRVPDARDARQICESVLSTYTPADSFLSERERDRERGRAHSTPFSSLGHTSSAHSDETFSSSSSFYIHSIF